MGDENMFYCSFVSIHYIICECGETFPSEEALKNHLETEHKYNSEKKDISISKDKTDDPTCQTKQFVQIKLEDHNALNFDSGTLKLEKKIVKLENNVLTLQDHEDAKRMVKLDPRVRNLKKERPEKVTYHNIQNIVCEMCGKRYASNAALRYHQRIHTGERPYQCSYCPKTFTMPLFLQIHLRTHTGERPYPCPLCPKAFSNRAALLRHNRVHTGAKPYECPKCGKTFTQSNSMKLHVHTVHLKMPAPYKSKRRREESKARELRLLAQQSIAENGVEYDVEVDMKTEASELCIVKPEVDLYQEEVEEAEVLYGIDMEDEGVTYEVVYEEE
ncbi:zinc finger protein 300-like [Achroia grisella]|uniref:zinc finger protein 300-like n=1 Tax=Achroia grisella TaxID=688607 RepID=UPI0027D32EEC|nr:zinc finger protein 300-like [Achroia grisella]